SASISGSFTSITSPFFCAKAPPAQKNNTANEKRTFFIAVLVLFSMAIFVFLSTATRTGIVSSYLFSYPDRLCVYRRFHRHSAPRDSGPGGRGCRGTFGMIGLKAAVIRSRLLPGFLYLLGLLDRNGSLEKEADHLPVYPGDHLLEELKRFKLINKEWVLLFIHRILHRLSQV